MKQEELIGATYYNGELTPLPKRRLTREEQWRILNTHPFFTHQCPECGYRFDPHAQLPAHWSCPDPDCGWVDDSR